MKAANGGFMLWGWLLCGLWLLAACAAPPTPTRAPLVRATVVIAEAPPRSSPTPSLAPTVPVCPGAPSVQLIRNARGRVLDDDPRPLNMRSAPGIASAIVWSIGVNTIFDVLDGPVCADGYNWFYIRYDDLEGWIAEGDNTSYFVEPFLPG
ncbi:MAG: SH3 domain-containing protein [Chloroflexi bacterium]|nr:SH3 domain-containing protein [Chloroflexota bacterium]